MKRRTKKMLIIFGIIGIVIILFALAMWLLKINVSKFLSDETTILIIFVVVIMGACLGISMFMKTGD